MPGGFHPPQLRPRAWRRVEPALRERDFMASHHGAELDTALFTKSPNCWAYLPE